jgi:hypothetical protein
MLKISSQRYGAKNETMGYGVRSLGHSVRKTGYGVRDLRQGVRKRVENGEWRNE